MLGGVKRILPLQRISQTTCIEIAKMSPGFSPHGKDHIRTLSLLPKLPIPPLKQTLGRFLLVAKPLTSPDEFERTKLIVDDFGSPGGKGEQLQELLLRRSRDLENWLSEWWLENAYLLYREPLIVNSSPGLSFPKQNYEGLDGQISFASDLIVALLEYKERIDKETLPVDMAGNQVLDMSQYKLLFGTCRIPGLKQDSLRVGYQEPSPSRHIIVAYRGSFYEVVVFDESGNRISAPAITVQLKKLTDSCRTLDTRSKVGLLTSDHRLSWASAYERLSSSAKNQQSLQSIQTGLFVLCIDEPVSCGSDSRQFLNCLGEQLLHGGGSTANSGNRWFDKTLQFVIGYNGGCGMTYEHSPAEGPPVAALMDFVMDHISQFSMNGASSPSCAVSPVLLEFDLTADTVAAIESAASNLDKLVSDVEVEVYPFVHFGKQFPKSQKLSPDSFIQLALQLAFYKLHKECPPAYETGTLRRFLFGRTDTIRLPTVDSVDFVSAMVGDESNVERASKLRRAIFSHKEYTAAACSGNGIDRHLLGLKLIALENGLDIPEVLKTSAYKTAMHFKLSTSQVASKHDACMLFGPMYNDCYGVCYNPQENKINFSITAFNSCPFTSAKRFATALESSLLEMQSVLATSLRANL